MSFIWLAMSLCLPVCPFCTDVVASDMNERNNTSKCRKREGDDDQFSFLFASFLIYDPTSSLYLYTPMYALKEGLSIPSLDCQDMFDSSPPRRSAHFPFWLPSSSLLLFKKNGKKQGTFGAGSPSFPLL
jgi:hypothetical protein